jgi:hypothetical protein
MEGGSDIKKACKEGGSDIKKHVKKGVNGGYLGGQRIDRIRTFGIRRV